MHRFSGRSSADELAGYGRDGRVAARADEAGVRSRVRAIMKSHGGLLGESWDAQADHAERVVAEVIEGQGLEAGRRWASSLDAELRATRDPGRMAGPGADAPGFDTSAAALPGRP
jgi:hypothetical protein